MPRRPWNDACALSARNTPPGESQSRSSRLISPVALGGFIIAAICLCMVYFLPEKSSAVVKNPFPLPVTPVKTATSTGAASASQAHGPEQAAEQDVSNTAVLHPERHVHRAPTTLHLRWNITLENRAPDGVLKPVYLINGQFPGPVIEVRSGDELVIDVHNGVDQVGHPGIAMHWHGLSMEGSNEMDGVVGLTQCAIQPSHTFTYQFRIPHHQEGTFWYHAHSALQRADGLYGALIVHRPVQDGGKGDDVLHDYQKEQLLLIGDWYHRTADEVLDWFVDPDHYGLEPAPDSLLLNGRGRFNCSMAVKARPLECQDVQRPILGLLDAQRIRLRVINTGVSAAFSLAVSNGVMELITVDGGYPVDNQTPGTKAIGLLYPGERMDMILDRAREYSHSSGHAISTNLTVELDRENMPLWNFALTRTQSFQMQSTGHGKNAAPTHALPRRRSVDLLNLADVLGQPVQGQPGLGRQPDEQAVLYSTMKIRAANHNRPVGSINHTSWITPDAKAQPLLTLERQEWEAAVPQPVRVHKFDVPWLKESGVDRWVDVVVNNFDDRGHPFHLHGYEFFVVAQARGTGMYRGYNPFDPQSMADAAPLNTHNPLRKDTVYVPSMGYVVMRFPLRNDGLWLLHCHVLWHQAVGMASVIQVGQISESLKQKSKRTCLPA